MAIFQKNPFLKLIPKVDPSRKYFPKWPPDKPRRWHVSVAASVALRVSVKVANPGRTFYFLHMNFKTRVGNPDRSEECFIRAHNLTGVANLGRMSVKYFLTMVGNPDQKFLALFLDQGCQPWIKKAAFVLAGVGIWQPSQACDWHKKTDPAHLWLLPIQYNKYIYFTTPFLTTSQ